MRIITNESHIETRTKLGEWAPLVGLIVLAISTAIIFIEPARIWISMILVWIGFLISIIGSYLGNRYVGPMAYHEKVPEALKGMTDDYTLLMYKLPVPFVLVEPGGLTTITVKAHGGEVKYEKNSWQHQEKWGFFAQVSGAGNLGPRPSLRPLRGRTPPEVSRQAPAGGHGGAGAVRIALHPPRCLLGG